VDDTGLVLLVVVDPKLHGGLSTRHVIHDKAHLSGSYPGLAAGSEKHDLNPAKVEGVASGSTTEKWRGFENVAATSKPARRSSPQRARRISGRRRTWLTCVAQRDEIVTGDTEHGYTEEPILFPAVTARPLQVGVAEAVASTPDHQELVVGRRLFAEDLGWRTLKRYQASLSRCGAAKWASPSSCRQFADAPASGSSVPALRFRVRLVLPRTWLIRAIPARSESVPMWWP
jgi:hypothetical protein